MKKNTQTRIRRIALSLLFTYGIASALEIPLAGGRLNTGDHGQLTWISGETAPLSIHVMYYAEGWRNRGQGGLKEVQTRKTDSGMEWTGTFREKEHAMSFTQTLEAHEGGVVLTYRLEVPAGFPLEPKTRGPFLNLKLPAGTFEGTTVSLGGKEYSIPSDNKWGNGQTVDLTAAGLAVDADPKTVMSLWKDKGTKGGNIRIQLPSAEQADMTVYEVEIGVRDRSAPSLSMKMEPEEAAVNLEGVYGAVRVDENGLIGTDKGLVLSLDWYRNGWQRRTQDRAEDGVRMTHPSEKVWIWSAAYVDGGKTMTLKQTLTDLGDSVQLEYELERPADYPFQPAADEPFLNVELPAADFSGQNILMGGKTFTLPENNAWATGGKLVLPSHELEFDYPAGYTMSIWKSSAGPRLRVQSKTERIGAEGESRRHTLRMTIGKQRTEVTNEEIENATSKKARNYPRVLNRATVKGVSALQPLAWLEQAQNQLDADQLSTAKDEIDRAEIWMDAQARVIDADGLLSHLELFARVREVDIDPGLREEYRAAAAALSEGNAGRSMERVAALREGLADAEQRVRESYGQSFLPGADYNPNTWVKAFTTMGYRPSFDPLTPGDPRPMGVAWAPGGGDEDGFEFLLVPEDAEDHSGYTLESTWTRTTWTHTSGKAYTFSILTPLIHVDGVEELPIRNLPGGVESISWRGPDGGWITAEKNFENWLLDEPPSVNGFWLRGDKVSLLLFVTKIPSGMETGEAGGNFRFSEPVSASILMLSQDLTSEQVEAERSFWAGVAARSPEDAVDLLEEGKVTHRMLYRDRPDIWDTAPREITPVPVLTALYSPDGGWSTRSLWTLAGDFPYVEGDRLTVDLPPRRSDDWKGINEYMHRLTDERLAQFKEMGVQWVRVVIGPRQWKENPEEGYAALGPVLERIGEHGMKALVDPHDFEFHVKSWDAEIPDDPEERGKFLTLWRRLAEISREYPEVVVGYDLYNELKVNKKNWASWDKLASEVIPVIREIDPVTPIYISGVDMSNPSGFLHAEPVEAAGENVVYSFHFYAPHSFSHQKIFRASQAAPFVFYPGWIPVVDWKNKTAYGGGDLFWWDRWTLQASMLAVLEFSARHHVAFHCGEIAPIGYSKPRAADGAGLWTRDGLDTLEQYGMSWHLWNQGFGLLIDEVAAETIPRWKATP